MKPKIGKAVGIFERKDRNIWENMGLALGGTPIVTFVGIILITLVGALDDGITKIQEAGRWWLIPIGGYILSLIYFLYEPTIRKNLEEKKATVRNDGLLDGLVLYWIEQIAKQYGRQSLDKEIDFTRGELLMRVETWHVGNPSWWRNFFPDEKYPKWLFEIVDNYIAKRQNQKSSDKNQLP
jgi:hypothetical protein